MASPFKRIQKHIETRGAACPVTGRAKEDLETLVRRVDRVRSLSKAHGCVELSPYMESLLRVSTR